MQSITKQSEQKIFDAHFHIIDPQFPLVENNGYLPPAFNIESYKKEISSQSMNVVGGAVVSGSFQVFDQTYLKHALKILGKGFVGVTQLPATVSDKEIIELNQLGVKAIRFNVKRGGSEQIGLLKSFSDRLYELVKWHTELYIDSKDLTELMPSLLSLKKFSIDHLGLSKEGLQNLKKLVEKGARVKATGFSRVNFNPVDIIKELTAINPNCVMFGTDLPSTRAPKPFSVADLNLIIDNFDQEQTNNFLYKNAIQFYNL